MVNVPASALFFVTAAAVTTACVARRAVQERRAYGRRRLRLGLSVRSVTPASAWDASQQKECLVDCFDAGILLSISRYPSVEFFITKRFISYETCSLEVFGQTLEIRDSSEPKVRVALYWPPRNASLGKAFIDLARASIERSRRADTPYR
jgi:hypothetical protein